MPFCLGFPCAYVFQAGWCRTDGMINAPYLGMVRADGRAGSLPEGR